MRDEILTSGAWKGDPRWVGMGVRLDYISAGINIAMHYHFSFYFSPSASHIRLSVTFHPWDKLSSRALILPNLE